MVLVLVLGSGLGLIAARLRREHQRQWVIATMMIVIALFLGMAEIVGKRTRSMSELGIGDAVAVGFAQCLALIPGSSRSGSTIMAGLFAGQIRETAARFSFLLSIPAIVESCFSSGVATAAAIVSGLAPGRFALTLIVGKSTDGRSLTGRRL